MCALASFLLVAISGFLIWKSIRGLLYGEVRWLVGSQGISRNQNPVGYWYEMTCMLMAAAGTLFFSLSMFFTPQIRNFVDTATLKELFPYFMIVIWLSLPVYSLFAIQHGKILGGNRYRRTVRIISRDEEPRQFWLTAVVTAFVGIIMSVGTFIATRGL